MVTNRKDIAKEVPVKKNFTKTQILITIILMIVIGASVYYLKPTEIKLPLPYTSELIRTMEFTCDSLVGTAISAEEKEIYEKGIFASVMKGTDKITINIEGNNLYFLTAAAFNAGTQRGDAWEIIKNTDNKLIAVYDGLNQIGTDYNMFILNKKSGLGLWTKTRADGLLSGLPDTQAYYLICK